MLQLSEADFHACVTSSPTLVVQFAGAEADGASEDLVSDFTAVTFARVDPAREPGLAGMFGIPAAPALLIFREGIVMYLEHGAHPPERVASLLTRIGDLDMREVRAVLEEERARTAVHMRRMCPTARRGPFTAS